jgi:hypothetical protein
MVKSQPFHARSNSSSEHKPFTDWLYTFFPAHYAEVCKQWYGDVTPSLVLEQVRKYDTPDPPLPDKDVESRTDKMFYTHVTSRISCDVIDDPYQLRIIRTSHPGYPSNIVYSNRGQAADYCAQNLRSYEDAYINSPLSHMWIGLSRGAVSKRTDEVKTRLVACPDTPFHISAMKFMQPSNAALQSLTDTPSSIGRSIFNQGYDKLAQRLLERTNGEARRLGCIDVSRWDGSLQSTLQWKICEARIKMLNTASSPRSATWWGRFIRACYANVIQGAFLFPNGQLFYRTHGQPSGWAGTAHDNTFCHTYLLWYILLTIFKRLRQEDATFTAYLHNTFPNLTDEDIIWEHIRIQIMGDDTMYSMPASLATYLTQTRIIAEYLKLGYKIKPGSAFESDRIQDLAWCNRQMKLLPIGVYVPWKPTSQSLSQISYPRFNTEVASEDDFNTLYAAIIGHYVENFFNVELREMLERYITTVMPAQAEPLWTPAQEESLRVTGRSAVLAFQRMPTRHAVRTLHLGEALALRYPDL